MIPIDDLRSVPLLSDLTEDRLTRLAKAAEPVALDPGAVLLRQGGESEGFFIIVEGELVLLQQQGAREIVAGRRTAPGFLGEISMLTGLPIVVTCRAQTACRLIRLDEAAFFDLLAGSKDFARIVFRSMVDRATESESLNREMEKMASLGTLAAGLAHEINNPAAAIVRDVGTAQDRAADLPRRTLALRDTVSDPGVLSQLQDLLTRASADATDGPTDPLAAADEEERLGNWLDAQGCEDAWTLAATLAHAGVPQSAIESIADACDAAQLNDCLTWIGDCIELRALLKDAAQAGERIATLVGAVKSYSYMDRDARQVVDVHAGLDDTLTILTHRLRDGPTVERRYDPALPRVTVYGSELNQVWTNLIDNAIDAAGADGAIVIETGQDGENIFVAVCDDGPGI
ncbi:MAG: cyclic nucleotide-binding domain-containing protein, partial [Alphaproteobacteria bacterium]|nr:cyclic nucleotide-binding domain-containing protein [Alphaproteobacteria bacterium]